MRKVYKVLLYILGGIILLITLAIVFLLSSWGKGVVRNQGVKFLSKKLETTVVIQELDYRLPKMISLKGVMLVDKNADTLVNIGNLQVDIDMLALIKSHVKVQQILLENTSAYIYRHHPDTTFNYQFIINSFVDPQKTNNEELVAKDTSGSKLSIQANKIALHSIHLVYDDKMGGTSFDIKLDTLVLRPNKIDFSTLDFGITELYVNGLNTFFDLDTSYLAPSPIDTISTSLMLNAQNIDLNNVFYGMLSHQDSFYFDAQVGKLKAQIDTFNLLEQLIHVHNIQLEQSQSKLIFGKINKKKETPPVDENDSTSNLWRITSKNILIKNVDFSLDDNNEIRDTKGIDYSHLGLQKIYLTGEDLLYSPDTISGIIKHLAAKEKSGVNLLEFKTIFNYNSKGAILKDFYLKTPGTLIQDNISIGYSSLSSLSKELDKLKIDINLINTQLSVNDILLFMPASQRSMLTPYIHQQLKLAGNLSGYLGDLYIKNLYLSGLRSTMLKVDGRVKGLPNTDQINYDLAIHDLKSSYQDIAPFLPDSLKQQLAIPEWFAVKGKIKGNLKSYHPDLIISTSDGEATVQGYLDMSGADGKEAYDLHVTTNDLQIGKILKMDSLMGAASINASIRGTSFTPSTINADFNVQVQYFKFRGYPYENLKLNGNVDNGLAKLHLLSTDPNVNMEMYALSDLGLEYPSLKAFLDIKNLDLRALHFMEDSLQLQGEIVTDFESLNPDYLNGYFLWNNPTIKIGSDSIQADTIYLVSKPTQDSQQNIIFDFSKIFTGSLTGKIPLTQVGNAFLAHVNQYYTLTDSITEVPLNYDMQLDASLNYRPLLKAFVSKIAPFDNIPVTATISPNIFDFRLNSGRLQYDQHILDTVSIEMKEEDQRLRYKLLVNKYQQTDGSFKIYQPTVQGYVRNDSLITMLSTKDSALVNQFFIGSYLFQQDSVYKAHLFKGLRFNYNRWDVDSANEIVFGKNGYLINNFFIHNQDQHLKINSVRPNDYNSPINLDIKNFAISNITSMFSGDTLIADGNLNLLGNIDLSDSFPKLDVDLNIQNLKAFDFPIGRLNAKANNPNANEYAIALQLTEQGNDLNVEGNYFIEKIRGNNLDFQVNIRSLALKSFEGLAFGNLKNSDGIITGDLKVQGSAEDPLIDGYIETKDLTTTITQLNERLSLPKERIVFTPGNIKFNDFKIFDTNNQKATINGVATTKNYTDYLLDLNFSTSNFLAMNSSAKDNDMFYGKLFLSSNLNIKGSATAPEIDGNLTIHDSTNFTFALLDDGPGIQETDGIVQFVNGKDSTSFLQIDTLLRQVSRRITKATQINVNVGIEKNAQFKLIVDPLSGDNLLVKGEASLNTNIAPDGTVGLVGTYELGGGYYQLNYNFLKRRFDIQSGSVITLAGDPLEADVNITAVYKASIAPYDLVFRQVSEDQLVYYKQRMPFEIQLKMRGKVMKPEITFDVVLPEGNSSMVTSDVENTVQSKLVNLRNNPSEMNKQVFAVLVLGRFISDDPFTSGTSTSAEFYARQSASRFLSQQLNQIAGQLVKGLDLSLDLESSEDYSTGAKQNRTDLNITASKRLFNDRLTVTIGNDFQLEGQSANRGESAIIPGNISLDYRLSSDGRYMIRAYRKNEMQNVIDGYVVETGASFRIVINYNRFKYIFRSRKKLLEQYRLRQEKEADSLKQMNQQ